MPSLPVIYNPAVLLGYSAETASISCFYLRFHLIQSHTAEESAQDLSAVPSILSILSGSFSDMSFFSSADVMAAHPFVCEVLANGRFSIFFVPPRGNRDNPNHLRLVHLVTPF